MLLLEELVIVRLHLVATLADQLLDGSHVLRACHIGSLFELSCLRRLQLLVLFLCTVRVVLILMLLLGFSRALQAFHTQLLALRDNVGIVVRSCHQITTLIDSQKHEIGTIFAVNSGFLRCGGC